jgi:Arc/MetJ-type ribon-helix-helix transcriptional regulator
MAGEKAIDGGAKIQFLDLPLETQRGIFAHCAQSDLICLALVSRHFHELASALLYRNFHIIFPDDDDLDLDSPIDGLAGGLDTFTTSDYNYAKHLRDLSMDTLSAGDKGEQSYQSYLYSASCGKFLNSLLYLTLKKSRSLEAFRWNIRVELSRPVYRVLHQIPSLRKLHLRLQAGESYYLPPPPLPVSTAGAAGQSQPPAPASTHHWYSPLSPEPLSATMSMLPPPTVSSAVPSGPPPALVPPSKSLSRARGGRRGLSVPEPSILSGFKNLQSLAVLDIDNLDIVNELRTCMKQSSSTLTDLQLSLSDSLAMQARKPPPDSEPDDSDVDDEFQVVPASQNTSYETTGPAKAFRAQEERKIQEAVLGRIFDVEPVLIKKPPMRQKTDDVQAPEGKADQRGDGNEVEGGKDAREEFVSSIKGVSSKLMCLLNGSRDFTISQQDILDTIEKAARKYVASGELPASESRAGASSGGTEAGNSSNDGGVASSQVDEAQENKNDESQNAPSPNLNGAATVAEVTLSEDAPTLLEGRPPKEPSVSRPGASGQGLQPEDIDIARLDLADEIADDAVEAQQGSENANNVEASPPQTIDPGATKQPRETAVPSPPAATDNVVEYTFATLSEHQSHIDVLVSKIHQFQSQADVIRKRVQELQAAGATDSEVLDQLRLVERQLLSFHRSIDSIQERIKGCQSDIEGAESKLYGGQDGRNKEANRRHMDDYVRDTRGFALESLSIHLVPVKASVLSRAVDLSCLKQLTLLNVGNQAPIWTYLARENKSHPLALRSVFTDNVSNPFLTCMSQLEELHELFLLERGAKHKPESFAPRSSTTIDQIRRLVLKKHITTLKRLMIKDESNGPSWDANEKTMILICSRGINLEELAVSMNIHAVHAFMQYFSGLTSLRAINILHFRNNDTCIWVMREILRFIVDNLSHHPELKLEWIAMEDDRVDRVVRPLGEAEAMSNGLPGRSKDQSKGKQPASTSASSLGPGNEAFPYLPVEGLDSDSESEDDTFDSGTRLRFKTVGPLQFYDVWNVKIFEKEIRSGKL